MIDQQIKQLAERPDCQHSFLSLYIDTTRDDESQRDRIRVNLKDELKKVREAVGGHNGALDKSIRQIEQYVETALEPETRGLAIFACPTEDFFVAIQLPVTVQPTVSVGNRPSLKPLLRVRHSNPHAVVVLVDAKYARLFDLDFARVLREIDVENLDLPRRHDQGGWSQANMQRHVQDHIDRHHKEVAETLAKMFDHERLSAVIISGQERNLANFRGFLPKRVDEKVIGTLHLDIRTPDNKVVEACAEVVRQHRAQTLSDELEALEASGQKQARAALGFWQVVEATNQRKLLHLYLSDAAEEAGWRCLRCGMIGQVVPLECPACENQVTTVDLVEQIVAAAESEGAQVDFVGTPSRLDEYDGIGALLRF